MASLVATGSVGLNMDTFQFSSGRPTLLTYVGNSTQVGFAVGPTSSDIFDVFGSGLAVASPAYLGTVFGINAPLFAATRISMGINASFDAVTAWFRNNDAQGMFASTFTGNDQISGFGAATLLRGYEGNDSIQTGGGMNTVFGGLGDDTVTASSGQTYLRGDEGNDSISGGNGFDDINGNEGNDTAAGGAGADWVVGGKDNDLLYGDKINPADASGGDDIVYGNLGDDTCDGGAGNDLVRGGQGNDSISGGPGADWLSGDKGDDTISGGAGADTFHSFGDAGLDRVLDFSRAEGDRVQLDPGTVYTVAQVGADTVISMTGGAQMVLVGVQMATLTGNWIFLA